MARVLAARRLPVRAIATALEMEMGPGAPRPWRLGLYLWLTLALPIVAILAGCAQTLPGGAYTNTTYHFRVAYPNGWQATSSTGDATIPLTVTFTRSASHAEGTPGVSALTISVQSLSSPYIAKSAAGLASNQSLRPITLSGLPAYTSGPLHQALPGAQGTPALWIPGPNGTPTPHALPAGATPPPYDPGTVTHTDYYLVHGGYEYQLSTDAMSTDGVDSQLSAMVQSFTILS